jgi:hypothetical protein
MSTQGTEKPVSRRTKANRENGKKGGRPVDLLDVDQITKTALATVGAGLGSRQIIKGEENRPPVCTWLSLADRISPEAANWLKKAVGCSPEEFRDLLGSRLEQVVAQAVSTLETRIADMSGRDLALTFGILNDHLLKTRGFSGAGSLTVHQTNVQINGLSRSDALAALTGKQGLKLDADCNGFARSNESPQRAPAVEITVNSDSKIVGAPRADSDSKILDQLNGATVTQTVGRTSENGGNVRENT